MGDQDIRERIKSSSVKIPDCFTGFESIYEIALKGIRRLFVV
jgi:hypothetical protein